MDTTPEIKKGPEVFYVGRLKDLGLGNPEGIPSTLKDASETELNEFGEDLKSRIIEVTDIHHCGCIDGRHCKHNADGSAPEHRLRRVGGSGSNIETAFNSGASVIDTIDPASPIDEIVDTIDEQVEQTTGFERSAHLGGCGGVNGAIEDEKNIARNPAIMNGVAVLMGHPAIAPTIGMTFDYKDGEAVRQRADKTAGFLTEAGWNGQAYVDRVKAIHPAGVEDLEVADDKFGGHAEKAVIIVVGDKTLDMDDVFVWNTKASIEVARGFAGQRGEEGYRQALIAEFAKHLAVADRLPSDDTPVFILTT